MSTLWVLFLSLNSFSLWEVLYLADLYLTDLKLPPLCHNWEILFFTKKKLPGLLCLFVHSVMLYEANFHLFYGLFLSNKPLCSVPAFPSRIAACCVGFSIYRLLMGKQTLFPREGNDSQKSFPGRFISFRIPSAIKLKTLKSSGPLKGSIRVYRHGQANVINTRTGPSRMITPSPESLGIIFRAP